MSSLCFSSQSLHLDSLWVITKGGCQLSVHQGNASGQSHLRQADLLPSAQGLLRDAEAACASLPALSQRVRPCMRQRRKRKRDVFLSEP